jgi:hypothetical protein
MCCVNFNEPTAIEALELKPATKCADPDGDLDVLFCK